MADCLQMALNQYHYVLDTLSDPRVADWPLMASPWPTLLIVATYLLIATRIGPRLMANRKPFKLNKILVMYNALQVIATVIMLWEHLMAGWWMDYSLRCQPVDYSLNPKALRMANVGWWYFISKLSEFTDTLFFVLRKKDNQLSFLHLYHHSLTPIESWFGVKYLPGGHGTFGNVLNNFVHLIMYSYYLMAAMGPRVQKYLWWKNYLTGLQMLQFVLVFIHGAQLCYIDCGYPQFIGPFTLVHSAIFFGLFLQFYLKSNKKSIVKKTD